MVAVSFQQPDEPGLLKVVVGSQSVRNGTLSHGYEARAIHKTPHLVVSVAEQIPCVRVQHFVDVNDLD
jgi:hypothetical protein